MIEQNIYCIIPYNPLISFESNNETPFYLFLRITRPLDSKEMNQSLYISLKHAFSDWKMNMHRFQINRLSSFKNGCKKIFISFKKYADPTFGFIYSVPCEDFSFYGEGSRLLYFVEKEHITIRTIGGFTIANRKPGKNGIFFLCQEIDFPRTLEIRYNKTLNSIFINIFNFMEVGEKQNIRMGAYKMRDDFVWGDSEKVEIFYNRYQNHLLIIYLKTCTIEVYRFSEQIV